MFSKFVSFLSNLRNFFWFYPKNCLSVIRITLPLFYVVVGVLLSYVFFTFLTSEAAGLLVEDRDRDVIVEGTIGGLSSVNPVYITKNPVDRDFYALVFDKFIDVDADGQPVAGIAREWEQVSDLEYLVTICDDIYWHDGVKLTADDIVWNFRTSLYLANDYGHETYGSALGAVTIEKVDDYQVRFVLEESNATFWEAVAVYIVPKHIYEDVPLANFDRTKTVTNVVGSGVYEVVSINDNGMYLFSEDAEISHYRYLFFENYSDLNLAIKNNEIDVVSYIDLVQIDDLDEYPFWEVKDATLYNRQKLLYFNMRREKLKDVEIRQALSHLVDKEKLLEVADVGGVPAKGPISVASWAFNEDENFKMYDPDLAEELLESQGYVRDGDFYTSEDEKILSFELKYLENYVNTRLVESLEGLLQDEGVFIQPMPMSYNQISMEVLPTRNFELMLNEVETTVDPDQYNLWHSLMIDHPHLNISGYDYSRVDILLERARTTLDRDERLEDYTLFQRYVVDDAPAMFLYHPEKTFIVRKNLNGFQLDEIVNASDRFSNVEEWFWD